uniref:Solute carrier family 39 member 1 n=1 Tax=Sphenodon punctatus TaxID=8508 RepID=A0A8D0GGF0_SPHPU
MAEWLGPGADPEQMVWSPGAYAATRRSTMGLEVKLGSLVTLLLATILSGLLPLCIFRQPGTVSGSSETRRKVLSLLSCFAGGVFLATCLLDLLPNYLDSINEALDSLRVTLQFPLQEFILAMGFFLLLVMEQIVLAYRDQAGSSLEETRALLGAAASQARLRGEPAEEHPHFHIDLNAHSAIRSFMLLFALSLHSVFEGLAVGLQEAGARALEICLALLIHKCVIAFSLSLKLLQGRLRPRAVTACLLLFAAMSPLGIGVGVALTEGVGALHRLARSVLEGLATGTFVYITFLEILPHELGSPQQRILKVILLVAGFALVTSVLFIKI